MAQIDLQQIQTGHETVWGTTVAASAKLMDTLDLKIDAGVKSKIIKTRSGSLGSGHLAVLESVKPKGSYKGVATYEDILQWVETMFSVATPAGGPNYTRAYAAPLTAIPTPRSLALYYGNTVDTSIYKMLGTRASKLNIAFESNKEAEYSLELLGKSVATGALAALSDRTVTPVMGNDLTLYLDTWAGTMGATALTATAWSADLEIDTHIDTLPYFGALGPGVVTTPQWTGTLKIRMEFNATSKALYEAYLPGTSVFQRQVQLKATTGATAIFQIGFAGTCENIPTIFDERDGVCALEFTLENQYHATFANWLKIDSTNTIAALV